ncbi:hypothetical protein B0H66DRAFT_537153 [Apodospora peruviana]|uniref:HAUS augmin-like complex subunit 1 n=1 Tax=Apodospora peruviana TaxID=516989 RepID=A0AAE0HVZ7_9PEZI|nr:hypothetical protein B0H66DRAFT_537153 [Apodospora peruviana]
MAHLLPDTAIFSPSVARAVASAAKDWNFVDSWLQQKFHGRSPPAFERNADTLRTLLALASVNEAADEERELIARLEADALHELRQLQAQQDQGNTADAAREAVLSAVEDGLSREGTAALNSMASVAVDFGMAFASPADLGRCMVELSAQADELEQMEARVGILSRYLEQEARGVAGLVKELKGEEYRPASDLAKQNLEIQRKIRTIATRLPELRDKVASLENSVGMPSPTIDQVQREEQAYLALLAQKKELDAQVKSFQGLPPNTDQARQELESLRTELRRVTNRRNAVFEGLVERETPKKPTRLP